MNFQTTANGYDPEEVKRYIALIQGEYQKLYAQAQKSEEQSAEIQRLTRQNEQLQNQLKNQAAEPQPASYDAATVGKALLEAEHLAAKLLGDAKLEATRLLTAAKLEATRLVETARAEEKQIRVRIKSIQTQISTNAGALFNIGEELKRMSGNDEIVRTAEPGVHGGAGTETARVEPAIPAVTATPAAYDCASLTADIDNLLKSYSQYTNPTE
ncbi:MAG: DivIVA domain-containing protein [Oscillospiraceae bacterium]|jgi:cell division septum initiation protein DivIVA|nr:DivIVA domain-containing protein [Oscillospiraceae bacterium]